jgi:hypothetical protein
MEAIMNRFEILLLIVLTGCQLTPHSIMEKNVVPSIYGFDFSQNCPHGCWLGINPGITTADEAKSTIQASSQVDKQQFLEFPDGIIAGWYPKNSTNATCTVGLRFEKGVVDTLYVTNLDYTVKDFVGILGQPDLIKINVQKGIVDLMAYSIYFSSRKVMIGVLTADLSGPAPSDTGLTVWLNV